MFLNDLVLRLRSAAVVTFLFLPASLCAATLFKPAQIYSSGSYLTFSVAVGDLNGDGKPDLVVANQNCGGCEGVVSVMLGNGDGSFQSAVTYNSGGQNAFRVALADVNGDGKSDVLVANLCSLCDHGIVSVLLGNGNGTLQAARSYSSGGITARSLAVADVNQDGKLDVMVTNGCENVALCPTGSVGVLLGNGDGTFRTAHLYNSGAPVASSVAVADLNGDGKPDLVIANQNDSSKLGVVGVLLGNGNGTFQAAKTYSSGGSEAFSIAVGDVNQDGKLDVAVMNVSFANSRPNTGAVGVLLGNGDGTLQAVKTYGSGGFLATSIALADLNRDGKLDVVGTNWGNVSSNVGVLLGNGDGTFLNAQTYKTGGQSANWVTAADVNGDGKIDLVVANDEGGEAGTGTVSVLLGTAKFVTTVTLSSDVNPTTIGQQVTLTATVSSVGSIAPTGKVTFKIGATAIGSRTLSNGVAILTTTTLPIGTLSITATYNGDIQSARSTSAALVQVVRAATGTE
jgi:hypothetical protein